MFSRIRSAIRCAIRRNKLEREMTEEMRFHLDAVERDLITTGIPASEARRRAQLQFGNIEAAKEECRQAKGLSLVDETVRNLRYAMRLLRRAPGFSLAVIGTLALCIGANTAIFSVVDAVLFRPLPYPNPERLGTVVRQFVRGTESSTGQSQDGYAWEAFKPARGFDVAAYSGCCVGVNLGADNRAEYIRQQRISAKYFQVLGVPLFIGREFNQEEDRAGGPQAVILTYELWKRVFHGDPGIIGRSILLRGEPHTVVGVTSERFRPMGSVDVWTPLRPSITGEGGGQNYIVIARLHPGVTWAQARTETQSLGVSALEHLNIPRGIEARMDLLPLQQVDSSDIRDRLLILWAAVAVVLIIGCVNVASLMLARNAPRGRELGTRMALGGGAAALIRQLTTEALILGLLGGATGLALAWTAIHSFQSISVQFGIWQDVRLDARVLWGTLAVSILTSLLFGLAPALQVTRVDVRTALAAGGSRAVAGVQSHWLKRVLVVTEVALGLVLVTSAGLLIRTLLHLENLSPGFDGSNVLTASVSLQDARYRSAQSVNRLYRLTLERLRQTPGVEAAAVGLHVPYQRWLNAGVEILGTRAAREERLVEMTTMNYVTPGYFQVLRIPLRSGREIDERDKADSLPVAMVNNTFAQKYLRALPAIGSHMKIHMDGTDRQIIGVVGDIRERPSFGGYGPLDSMPAVYVPVTQLPDQNFQVIHTWFSPVWVVRGAGSIAKMTEAVQRSVQSVDPLLPIANFHTFENEKNAALRSQRSNAWLMAALAGLALLLAIVGVYGLVANSVVERTRDLGIRLALGATARQVIWTATKPGVVLSLAGVLIGLGLATISTRVLKSYLYGVQALDPATFLITAAGFVVIGTLASLIPALRLTRLNASETLRQE